jgi:hypothetical protein
MLELASGDCVLRLRPTACALRVWLSAVLLEERGVEDSAAQPLRV